MKRESGYYWIKDGEKWIIAKWSPTYNCWDLTGNENDFQDWDFTEIDERKIERQ